MSLELTAQGLTDSAGTLEMLGPGGLVRRGSSAYRSTVQGMVIEMLSY
jgi:hypothetical protein